ncbi:MAG TPA: tRNA lysidine(34) synthetase TilS [Hansschlegelia sp.]
MLDRLDSIAVSDAVAPAEAAALFGAFVPPRHLLLAVSGGADSTALLVLAAEWASEGGARLSVATVDHALRAEADIEIAEVAALSARFGLPHARLPAPVASASRIEERARDLRYAALADHARAIGADAIATAHTLDDQAETVLMRLAAGSGPSGLAGMRTETFRDGVRHVRPLLGVAKRRLVATLEARGIAWFGDAMNVDGRFARARLRAARDALAREGLTAARLGVLAGRMARADAALETATDDAARLLLGHDAAGWTIAPGAVALPDEIRLRLLGRALTLAGGGRIRLERLERLARRIAREPEGAATLAGARVAWAHGAATVRPAPPRRGGGAKRSAGL